MPSLHEVRTEKEICGCVPGTRTRWSQYTNGRHAGWQAAPGGCSRRFRSQQRPCLGRHQGSWFELSGPVHEITVARGDQTYIVKAGDNLSKISKLDYGDANKYEKIAKANSLDNPDKIRVGQTLTIPAA